MMKTHGLRAGELAVVLGDRDRVITALDAALSATRTPAVDATSVAFSHCVHRIATLLGAQLMMPVAASALDPAGRACAAFAEQWVIDVASMPDSLVADLAEHLGNDGRMDFVHALLVEEQRIRLDLAWQRLGLLPLATEYEGEPQRLRGDAPATGESAVGGRSGDARLNAALSEWQAAVVCLDEVDPITTELVRLRCANYHDCHT